MKRDKNVQDAVQKEVVSSITPQPEPPKTSKKASNGKRSSPSPKKPKLDKEELVTEITTSIMAKMPQIMEDAGYVKIPKHIITALETVAKSDYKRFKKWNYPGLLGHLEIIIDFFGLKIKK